MRELEFRAWIIEQKRMIYNIGLELPCCKIIEYEDVEKADYLLMAPRRIAEYGTGLVKIMQYTGLHDNTQWESLLWHDREKWLRYCTAKEWCGRKIYEGDWLRFVEEHEAGCQCEHCWPCRIGEIVGVKWVNDRWHLLPADAYLNGEEGDRENYCEECSSRGGLYSPNHEIPIGCYAKVIGNIYENPGLIPGS